MKRLNVFSVIIVALSGLSIQASAGMTCSEVLRDKELLYSNFDDPHVQGRIKNVEEPIDSSFYTLRKFFNTEKNEISDVFLDFEVMRDPNLLGEVEGNFTWNSAGVVRDGLFKRERRSWTKTDKEMDAKIDEFVQESRYAMTQISLNPYNFMVLSRFYFNKYRSGHYNDSNAEPKDIGRQHNMYLKAHYKIMELAFGSAASLPKTTDFRTLENIALDLLNVKEDPQGLPYTVKADKRVYAYKTLLETATLLMSRAVTRLQEDVDSIPVSDRQEMLGVYERRLKRAEKETFKFEHLPLFKKYFTEMSSILRASLSPSGLQNGRSQ